MANHMEAVTSLPASGATEALASSFRSAPAPGAALHEAARDQATNFNRLSLTDKASAIVSRAAADHCAVGDALGKIVKFDQIQTCMMVVLPWAVADVLKAMEVYTPEQYRLLSRLGYPQTSTEIKHATRLAASRLSDNGDLRDGLSTVGHLVVDGKCERCGRDES